MRFGDGARWVVDVLGSAEARRRERWLIAVVLGTLTCLYAFGLAFVLGRGSYWEFPGGDVQTNLIGYRFFVADEWRYPLLKTALIAGPKGTNIAMLDSIPIVALPGKLLAPVLGTTFVPYGLWMLAVYVLQAYFAIRLLSALGHRTRLAALAAAAFALAFAPFLSRFYHLALSGHFVILWALCLYFELHIDASKWRAARCWAVMLITALLVHPYLFTMSLAIFAAALARGVRLDARVAVRRVAVALVVVATIAVTGTVTGHFARSVRKAAPTCCFGESSLNLGSFVVPNPQHSQLWPHTPGALIDQTGWQWDGSCFLGFGVLLLIGLALVRSPRALGRTIAQHAPLAIVLVGFVAFAASNRAFVFDRVLWSFDIPDALAPIASTFRAGGRFSWPFGLAVGLGILAFTLRTLPAKVAVPLLIVLSAVSLADVVPLLRIIRANMAHASPRVLDRTVYEPALRAHARVEQWPSYQCAGAALAFADQESRELQFMTAELGRPINGARAGRQTIKCRLEHERWRPYQTPPGVIAFHLRAQAPARRPPECRPLGIWVICTQLWAHPDLAKLRALTERDAPPPTYRLGDRIDFGPTKAGARFLEGQWDHVISYRAIYVGEHSARLRLSIDAAESAAHAYMLSLEVIGWRGSGLLHIRINDTDVGPVQVEEGEHEVALEVPAVMGPSEIALNTDASGFLVGVRAVTLTPRHSPAVDSASAL